jgi:hypothetical protein
MVVREQASVAGGTVNNHGMALIISIQMLRLLQEWVMLTLEPQISLDIPINNNVQQAIIKVITVAQTSTMIMVMPRDFTDAEEVEVVVVLAAADTAIVTTHSRATIKLVSLAP